MKRMSKHSINYITHDLFFLQKVIFFKVRKKELYIHTHKDILVFTNFLYSC